MISISILRQHDNIDIDNIKSDGIETGKTGMVDACRFPQQARSACAAAAGVAAAHAGYVSIQAPNTMQHDMA